MNWLDSLDGARSPIGSLQVVEIGLRARIFGRSPIVDHAFHLLEKITQDYSIVNSPNTGFVVEVRLDGHVGRAAGGPKARTISLAVAMAIKLKIGAAAFPANRRSVRQTSRKGV